MFRINYTFKDIVLIIISALTLLFFFLSFYVDDYKYVDIYKKDVQHIETRLHKILAGAGELFTGIVSKSIEDEKMPVFDGQESALWNSDYVSIYVFKNNDLYYWSDNLPVTTTQLLQIDTVEHYTNIGNSWYIAKSLNYKSYKGIILVLVKTEYPYQNDFLKNEFNPTLGFFDGMEVHQVGSDEGLLIQGTSGTPLFVITIDVLWGEFKISTMYRWLGVICLILLIILVFYNWASWERATYPLLILFALLLTIRLLVFFSQPYFEEGVPFFSPTLYAASAILRSLGDLFLHVLFSFIFIYLLYRNKSYLLSVLDRTPNKLFYAVEVFSVLCIAIIANLINFVIESLVQNSSITFEVYRISSLTQYSVLSYLIIAVLLAGYFLLVHLQAKVCSRENKYRLLMYQLGAFLLVSFFFTGSISWVYIIFVFVFFGVAAIAILYLNVEKPQFKFYTLSIALFAFYTTIALVKLMSDREMQKREVWAQNLATERDLIAEMLLRENEEKIASDIYILQALESKNISEHALHDRLVNYYFKGYFRRYDIDFQICEENWELHLAVENEYVDCNTFFEEQKSLYGSRLSGSRYFWYMTSYNGRIYYLGEFHFKNRRTHTETVLYVNLYSKLDSESIGYPELLLDNDTRKGRNVHEYAYAKYVDGHLMSHAGNYDYSFSLESEIIKSKQRSWLPFLTNNLHYMYSPDERSVILVSQPNTQLVDIASMFSYTFVFLLIVLLILLSLAGYPLGMNIASRMSYKRKLTYMLLISITLSLTVLTVAVLIFSVRQSEQKNIEIIEDKMRSIIIELDQSVIPLRPNKVEVAVAEPILVNLSNTFYTDLNLYDANGDLIASSRNEIFDKKLMGTKMNREAFETMVLNQSSKFVHTESIGQQEYYSAYSAYYNQYGEFVAYINLPYFFRQSEFREEILSLVGAIINIYILLILAGSGLAIFVSNQISRPLEKIREKISGLNLTSHYETIDYKGNDELGDLVREYNKMVVELAESARKLAQSEREWAWREMARQIAHEIKNPLTPMRLSIQHLIRLKSGNVEGWQTKVEPIARSLLNQIDVLSNIATEFSSFARENNPVLEPVDLTSILDTSCELFSAYTDIEIIVNNEGEHDKYVPASKERLQRVFTNLIKNAVQALENKESGKIYIDVTEKEDNYIITFEDTGDGVPADLQNNLFQPNFTTKSSGTGLGLAISKNIVQSFSGTIYYRNGSRGGACFVVELPKYTMS